MLPEAIGPYRVTGTLGRGGMGIVLRGQGSDGREVAIKLLREVAPAAVQRFDRERRLQTTLGATEGFVPLLDAGSSPSGPYLVMPLVSGGTLRDRLHAGPLAPDAAVALVRALAETVGRAHALGIVHRDLKPENVLFDGDRPLVADLGLGKAFGRAPGLSANLSKTGDLRGTAGYMAPEQMEDGRTVAPTADVFALGAILHECLTGAPAFVGESVFELIESVTRGRRAPLPPETPAPLARAVERCLALDPADRPRDGAALGEALGRLDAQQATRGRRALAALAAAATLVTLGGLVVASGRGAPAPPASGPPPPATATDLAPSATTAFPSECSGFLETSRTRLDAVLRGWVDEHADPIFAVAFVPGDREAVTASYDRTVRLWDLGTGEQVRVIGAHEDAVMALAVASDGSVAVTGGAAGDPTVRVWDLRTPGPARVLRGHTGAVASVALSPDARRVASASADGSAAVWDLATGARTRTIAHGAPAWAVAFSTDGQRVLVGGEGPLALWDVATGERLRALDHPARVVRVGFSPDGLFALSVGHAEQVRVWDLMAEEHVTLSSPQVSANDAVFTPDGRAVLTGNHDHTLRLWDAATGAELATLPGHQAWVRSVAVSADGQRALSGGHDATLRSWDLERRGQLRKLGGAQGWAAAVATSRDGRHAATPSFAGAAHVWDVASGRLVRAFPHPTLVSGAVLTANGRLVTSGHDGALRVFDVETGRELAAFEGHVGQVTAVVLTPDETRVLSSGWDGTVRVWELTMSPRGERILRGHTAHAFCVAALDDARAVSAGHDGAVIVWDLRAASSVHTLRGHEGSVAAVAVVPGGRLVVSGGSDGTVRLWDVEAGALVRVLGAHEAAVWRVAVSPDGRLALSTGHDRTARLWRLPDGGAVDVVSLASSQEAPLGATFTPDGAFLLLSTTRGAVLRFALR